MSKLVKSALQKVKTSYQESIYFNGYYDGLTQRKLLFPNNPRYVEGYHYGEGQFSLEN